MEFQNENENEIESVADYIRSVNEDVIPNAHKSFGSGLKKYLMYLLDNHVNKNLVTDYCMSIGKKIFDFASRLSMDEGKISSYENNLKSVINEPLNNEEWISRVCDYLAELVRYDRDVNKIEPDFSVFRFLKIPSLVEVSFRGHADCSWHINPLLYRNRCYKYEKQIYYEMIERSPKSFNENVYENLVLMQHYSCPTRLLDITFNPLVALYFACQKVDAKLEKEGRVLAFANFRSSLWDDVAVQAQSKVALLDYGEKVNFWNSIISNASLNSYGKVFSPEERKPVNFLVPIWARTKMFASRIERQSGAFVIVPEIGTFHDCLADQERTDSPLDHFVCKSYKICGDKKDSILRELDVLNINEASLFDGLEHIGHHEKTMYE